MGIVKVHLYERICWNISPLKSKMTADIENIDPLAKNIIRRVEYYFGDFNLPRDKFLNEETKKEDGWVTFETMLNFKRLADLSKDVAVIVAALKQSKSGLLSVSEDDLKIRRDPTIPLPENTEESKKALEARTAYAKGFDKEKTTLDELLDHFNSVDPSVVSIQMRNYADKKGKEKTTWLFKGSIFITFKTKEDADAFVDCKDQYKEATLLRLKQTDYFEMKNKENAEKRKGNKKFNKDIKEEGKKEENDVEDFKLPTGALLKITGLGGEVTREDIKEVLQDKFSVNISKDDDGDIAFITYEKGEAEATVRFKVENFAKPIGEKWNASEEKLVIKEMTTECSVLEGEAESKFLADSIQDMKNRRNKNKKGHGHKRRGGFQQGRGGKRGRR